MMNDADRDDTGNMLMKTTIGMMLIMMMTMRRRRRRRMRTRTTTALYQRGSMWSVFCKNDKMDILGWLDPDFFYWISSGKKWIPNNFFIFQPPTKSSITINCKDYLFLLVPGPRKLLGWSLWYFGPFIWSYARRQAMGERPGVLDLLHFCGYQLPEDRCLQFATGRARVHCDIPPMLGFTPLPLPKCAGTQKITGTAAVWWRAAGERQAAGDLTVHMVSTDSEYSGVHVVDGSGEPIHVSWPQDFATVERMSKLGFSLQEFAGRQQARVLGEGQG